MHRWFSVEIPYRDNDHEDILAARRFDLLKKITIRVEIRIMVSLQWHHNEHDSVSNHQPHDFLLNRLFRRRSKKTSKLRVTGLCEGNSPVTSEFPTQRTSNTENVSIWWRHHEIWKPVSRCQWFVYNEWEYIRFSTQQCLEICDISDYTPL